MTLWDPNGSQDVIDVSTGLTSPVLINLRPGEFSAIGTAVEDFFTGEVSFPRMNVGIAFGAVIEKAFGTNGDDTLIGNHVVNELKGNGGNDVLDGGVAETAGVANSGVLAGGGDNQIDTLTGGAGIDTYVLRRQGGQDILSDHGDNKLLFKGLDDLPAAAYDLLLVQNASNASLWENATRTLSATKESTDLIVTAIVAGSNDTYQFRIPAYQPGDFGIQLRDAPSLPITAVTRNGDLQAEDRDQIAPQTQVGYDSFNNLYVTAVADPNRADTLYDSNYYGAHASDPAVDDKLITAGGNDIAYAALGRDWLDLGAGDDIGYSGADNDLIVGGAGKDIELAGAGDDRLFGDVLVEFATIFGVPALLNGSGASTTNGEWLDGGANDDIVISGNEADVLLGGSGRDLLISGGGADTVYGDGATVNVVVNLGWTISRTLVPQGNGTNIATVSTTQNQIFNNQNAGDADSIYTGAGVD